MTYGPETILSLSHWGMFDITGCDTAPWVFGKVDCGRWAMFDATDIGWPGCYPDTGEGE